MGGLPSAHRDFLGMAALSFLLQLAALILLAFGLTLLWLEARHRLRPRSPLRLSAEGWQVTPETDERWTVTGTVTIDNPHARMEVFVPQLRIKPTLLGRDDLRGVRIDTWVTPHHPDETARADGYWFAYIVKGHKRTQARVELSLSGERLQERLDTLWVEVLWTNYGPFGRLRRRDGVLVPLRRPQPLTPEMARWREGDGCRVLPLKTHLLGTLDSPEAVLRHYAGGLLEPGDVLTIAESPLAVMQGRYIHPSQIHPSGLARQLCRVFHPTSSLATACGLQTLIDLVGPARVLTAWVLGSLMKLVGSPGGFYRLAGDQARLIDDVTGSTSPYDQTVVLGPLNSERIVDDLSRSLGHGVAVVDVNDLGRVKVLAASPGCDLSLLERALRPNPAGNANERTPLVVVRPAR
jgi:hypothetical protein